MERPRLRSKTTGKALALPGRKAAAEAGRLERWAMRPMPMTVATREAGRAVRLPDNPVDRGLDPAVCRPFIVDGAEALTMAIRRSFGADIPIRRCQVHKARNITERTDPKRHAAVRRALRQAREMNDADKAGRLLRTLARRLEREAPGLSKSILEGLDAILTVIRLGLPPELRRSAFQHRHHRVHDRVRRVSRPPRTPRFPASLQQVCRNVTRWRDAKMALRRTAAGMCEAARGFRRLKARKQLPILKAALLRHREADLANSVDQTAAAA